MLDIEKWWSVNLLAFTALDPSQVWSLLTSLDRLDQALLVPAQVRIATNALPVRRVQTLQQVVREWDYSAQNAALQQRLIALNALRYNADPAVLELVTSYAEALAEYLSKRSQAERPPETRMQARISASLVAQTLIRELERLDKRRQALHPGGAAPEYSP
jgi:hypothetical protein